MTAVNESDIADALTDLGPDLIGFPEDGNEPAWIVLGDRALRELADTRGEMAANQAALKVEIDRLRDAYEQLNLPLERKEHRLLGLLEQVAQALPLRGKRSRNLPHGTIGWRAKPARLEITDQKTTLDWVLMQDDATVEKLTKVVTETRIVKKELDAHCLALGDIPTGCELVPATDQFYATPSEPHA